MITRVQGTGASINVAGSSIVSGLTGTSLGNRLVVMVTGWSSFLNSPILSISDNNSNVWSIDESISFGYSKFSNVSVYCFSSQITNPGDIAVTVSSNISCLLSMSFDEWSSTYPLVVSATGVGNGNSIHPSASFSGSILNNLVVAGFDIRTSGLTYTPGTGLTLGFTENMFGYEGFISEWDEISTGSYFFLATLSSASMWAGLLVSYKEDVPTFLYDSEQVSSQEQAPLSIASNPDTPSLESDTIYQIRSLFDIFISLDQGMPLGNIYLADGSSSSDKTSLMKSLTDSSATNDNQYQSNLTYTSDLFSSIESQLPLGSMFFADSASEIDLFYLLLLPSTVIDRDAVMVGESVILALNFSEESDFEEEVYYMINSLFTTDTSQTLEF